MLVVELLESESKQCQALPHTPLTTLLILPSVAQFGCVFIVDQQQGLRGVITDGDLRRQLTAKNNLDSCLAADIMSPTPISVKVDTTVAQAFQLMSKHEINQVAVVGNQGEFAGVLTYHQIAQNLSPERLYIDLDKGDKDDNELRHIARYRFASQFIGIEANILDCACGSGYGSYYLSEYAKQVTGADICQQSIDFANEKYASDKVKFQCADLTTLDYQQNSFDMVVSFETLEHIDNRACRNFLCSIAQWVKPGGILVASSPMLRYKNNQPYVTNPYHINELPRAELLVMFKELLPGFVLHFYHQNEGSFTPLLDEHTGFCILVARKAQ